ncbi:MAG TPA: MFS transporter [Acidimicrobiia bacterium]|nr:MFS transporter [Acidimicrobiia bacterium]
MTDAARSVQRTYLLLTLLTTLAQSFIWGINTLFLLDAGLSNTAAFGANAFFTVGQVVFEVPTGVVADTSGRRRSFLLGTITLLLATVLYLLMWEISAPFWGWAVASVFLGLGFTFFSGAVEAWLVDALYASDYKGDLDTVFGRGQTVMGIAMLTGSVAGGFIAQFTNLGVPYIIRAGVLGITLVVGYVAMKDIGFTPKRGERPLKEVRRVLEASIESGFRKPEVRWLMLASPFTFGVSFYAFYAMQPHLLDLYGDESAFGIAGLAASILAGAQIVGGLIVPAMRRVFSRRTHALITFTLLGALALVFLGLTRNLWVAIGLLIVWSISFSASRPMRLAYLNGCIASSQRATVISFDSLMGSAGGAVIQPALGRVADVWSYGTSYVVAAGVQALALPFLSIARAQDAAGDPIRSPGQGGHISDEFLPVE